MMHSNETPLLAPFVSKFTTTDLTARNLSEPNRCGALSRVHRLWVLFLLLISCSLPFVLSGCGGQLIANAGTGTPSSKASTAANLSSLSCASGSMTGAGADTCTVGLSAAAPRGGVSVSLASNSSAVTLPATVMVGAGASSASFTASITTVSKAQTAMLTARANSVTKTFALQLGATVASTLSVNPATIAFGSVVLSSPATESVTLSSTGAAAVTVSAVTINGTGFTVSGTTLPLTLSPTQTATLDVEFDPAAAGAVSGSLTITSNSSTGSSTVIALSGTGESASTSYQVNLTWDAPTGSTDAVAGYYVYRSPSGGTSYQQLNTTATTQTTYADSAVTDGQTYDYIVESVDASGITSVPSSMASVVIP